MPVGCRRHPATGTQPLTGYNGSLSLGSPAAAQASTASGSGSLRGPAYRRLPGPNLPLAVHNKNLNCQWHSHWQSGTVTASATASGSASGRLGLGGQPQARAEGPAQAVALPKIQFKFKFYKYNYYY